MIQATQGRPSTGMSLTSCSPPDKNGAVRSLTAPAVPGPGVCIPRRMSNLDVNARLVKRGLKISYGGVRAAVVRVSRGRCCVKYMDYLGRPTGSSEWLKCESVQVVA